MSNGFKLIFNILAGFWVISFSVRPFFLVYTSIRGISTTIYDPRIADSPEAFINIMHIIMLGNAIFCLILYLSKKYIELGKKENRKYKLESSHEIVSVLKYGYIIGFSSFIFEQTPLRNPISKSLFPLIVVSFCTLIWKFNLLELSKLEFYLFIFFGSLGSILLSIRDNNSKGFLLMPLFTYLFKLFLSRKKRNVTYTVTALGIFTLIAIPLFNSLQSRKLGQTSVLIAQRNQDALPWFMSPLLTILQRFDQFPRIVDAYMSVGNPLGGYQGWINALLTNLQWNPMSGREAQTFGQTWNLNVTNQSIPGSRFSTVSLAQGPLAEGYIWAGYSSLVIECLVMSLLLVFVSRALEGNVLRTFLAFGIIGNGRIFENGTVAMAGGISSSLKFVIFMFIFLRVFKSTNTIGRKDSNFHRKVSGA